MDTPPIPTVAAPITDQGELNEKVATLRQYYDMNYIGMSLHSATVCLDGDFTVEQLKAIIALRERARPL